MTSPQIMATTQMIPAFDFFSSFFDPEVAVVEAPGGSCGGSCGGMADERSGEAPLAAVSVWSGIWTSGALRGESMASPDSHHYAGDLSTSSEESVGAGASTQMLVRVRPSWLEFYPIPPFRSKALSFDPPLARSTFLRPCRSNPYLLGFQGKARSQ